MLAGFDPHTHPFDPPPTKADDSVADVTSSADMAGLSAGGMHARTVSALFESSLDHSLVLGGDRIAACCRPLLRRLHEGLAQRGFRIVTPPNSRTPRVTCVLEHARDRLAARLKARGSRSGWPADAFASVIMAASSAMRRRASGFGRTNVRNPGIGTGSTDSFAYTFGPGSTSDGCRRDTRVRVLPL